jgi:hypothetical protein
VTEEASGRLMGKESMLMNSWANKMQDVSVREH